jgi:YidC/Oxa1 family membrane protein insertase
LSTIWNGLQSLLGSILAFFYDIIPNYGLAIILLTIVVNFVVFPLTLKQTRSTRAMQELQPDVDKIRKKFKDEPEAMNQEVMALYRERKVSPVGCFLPLVVQMPIWFALFRVLREPLDVISTSTSLGAALEEGPLTFLTMDLALEPQSAVSQFGLLSLEALPYLLLVAIVVFTGFMQQRLTAPRNGNQPQTQQAATAQKVTKVLPLFFGVISYIWPAGLNLYFATSNTFRTAQQLLIFKIDGRPGGSAPDKTGKGSDYGGGPDTTDALGKPIKPQGSNKKRNRRRRG